VNARVGIRRILFGVFALNWIMKLNLNKAFMKNAMRSHKMFKRMGKVFTTIITSQSLNGNPKLSFNFIIKGLKNRKQLRMIFH